ncbi:MAG: FecR family protein [Nitrospira sp.]
MPLDPSNKSSVADEALQWFALLKSGDAMEADRRQFQLWLDAAALHRQEFEKLKALWTDLDEIRPLVQEELAEMALPPVVPAPRQRSRQFHTWRGGWLSAAVAACLLVVVGAGWWFATRVNVTEYHTAKGEQRSVTLVDGSAIMLNTESRVRTEFSFTHRRVVLQEGEAFFTVSHEKTRPFEVMAGLGVVRDIGTQFLVRRQEKLVTVTVVGGAVEVRAGMDMASSGASARVLTVGEQLSYGGDGKLSAVTSASLVVSTAWMDGKLLFEKRPLSEVVREIGRYQDGEIRILDPAIATLNVSGAFSIHDLDGFLKALERAMPVKVSRINRDLVILEKSPPTSS